MEAPTLCLGVLLWEWPQQLRCSPGCFSGPTRTFGQKFPICPEDKTQQNGGGGQHTSLQPSQLCSHGCGLVPRP